MIIPSMLNGYSRDGIRTYFKGGSNSAAKKANRLEEERRKNIQDAINTINNIFDPKPYMKATGAVDTANMAYNPNATYYTADGKVFNPTWASNTTRPSGYGWNYDNDTGNYWKYTNDMFGDIDNGHDRKTYWNPNTAGTGSLAKTWADMTNMPSKLYTGLTKVTPTNEREQLYEQQRQAVYDLNKQSVNDQYEDAERANRFALARHGLLGGSADVDSNANLQEITNKGLTQAQALGQQAASQLRSSDEQAKQSLISLAQSGMDTGTAANMASQQLANNAQTALGERGGATIGQLFNGLSQAYLNNQVGQMYNDIYNRVYNNGTTNGGLNSRNTYQGDR